LSPTHRLKASAAEILSTPSPSTESPNPSANLTTPHIIDYTPHHPFRLGLGLTAQDGDNRYHDEEEIEETSLSRGWIGFDEENVVVLKEKSWGAQALVVYDFNA